MPRFSEIPHFNIHELPRIGSKNSTSYDSETLLGVVTNSVAFSFFFSIAQILFFGLVRDSENVVG